MKKLITVAQHLYYMLRYRITPKTTSQNIPFVYAKTGLPVEPRYSMTNKQYKDLIAKNKVISLKEYLHNYFVYADTGAAVNNSQKNANKKILSCYAYLQRQFVFADTGETAPDQAKLAQEREIIRRSAYINRQFVYVETGETVNDNATLSKQGSKLFADGKLIETKFNYDQKQPVYASSGKSINKDHSNNEEIISAREFDERQLINISNTQHQKVMISRYSYDNKFVFIANGQEIPCNKNPIKIGNFFYFRGKQVIKRKHYCAQQWVFADTGESIYLDKSRKSVAPREIITMASYLNRKYILNNTKPPQESATADVPAPTNKDIQPSMTSLQDIRAKLSLIEADIKKKYLVQNSNNKAKIKPSFSSKPLAPIAIDPPTESFTKAIQSKSSYAGDCKIIDNIFGDVDELLEFSDYDMPIA